jgi:hypothetical protein
MRLRQTETQLHLQDSNLPKLISFMTLQIIGGLMLFSSGFLGLPFALCFGLPGFLLMLTAPIWLLSLQKIEATLDQTRDTLTIQRYSRFVFSPVEQYRLSLIDDLFVDAQPPLPLWSQFRPLVGRLGTTAWGNPRWNDRHHLVAIVKVLDDRLLVPLSTAKLRRKGCEKTAVTVKGFLGV